MKNTKEVDQNFGKYRFVYQGKTTYYPREFTDSEKGQLFLKKMYKNKDSLKIYCTCTNKETIEMHLVKRGNGRSFFIRSNHGCKHKHRENCAHYVPLCNDAENENAEKNNGKNIGKAKTYKTYMINGDNGHTYASFNLNNFYENDLERNKVIIVNQSNKKTDNHYTGDFMLGEILLSTGWKNALRDNKKNPKAGNVFHLIYNNADKYKVRSDLRLSDIMYIPLKPDEEKDGTENMIKACYRVHYALKEKGYPNGKLYLLMKLLSYDPLEDDEKIYRIKLHDPYKKGEFVVYCEKERFKTAYNKHKVPGSDKYISASMSIDYVKKEKRLMMGSLAVIPVLKGHGLYMESQDEIQFANYLVKQKILFERPPKSCKEYAEEWDGYVPDFIFLNSTTLTKTTIAEVFGFWTEEYKRQMVKKINYYKKKPYRFVYWKSNENEPMPTLEKRTGKQILVENEHKEN